MSDNAYTSALAALDFCLENRRREWNSTDVRLVTEARDDLAAAISTRPATEAQASGQTLAGAGGALDAIYTDFCAKDNGDVPLERYPQGAVDALARAGWAVVPCDLPFAVLGDAAQAGVFETGNPKHGWDYLVARTRIGPNVTATSAGTTGDDSEDAARYRWLRSVGFGFAHDEQHRGISTMRWGDWPYDTDEGHAAICDAAIDAARRAREVG